jgi:hypothetical protein
MNQKMAGNHRNQKKKFLLIRRVGGRDMGKVYKVMDQMP